MSWNIILPLYLEVPSIFTRAKYCISLKIYIGMTKYAWWLSWQSNWFRKVKGVVSNNVHPQMLFWSLGLTQGTCLGGFGLVLASHYCSKVRYATAKSIGSRGKTFDFLEIHLYHMARVLFFSLTTNAVLWSRWVFELLDGTVGYLTKETLSNTSLLLFILFFLHFRSTLICLTPLPWIHVAAPSQKGAEKSGQNTKRQNECLG